jgi:predicted permease
MLFFEVVLPVFLMASAGFFLERKSQVDMQTLTNSSLYLFTPALVFFSLTSRTIAPEMLSELTGFMLLYTTVMILLAYAVARAGKFDGNTGRALILSAAMVNVGNFGLPLVYFAYGEAALDTSILTFVLFNIPLGTLAIIIAQGSGVKWSEALSNMLRIPIFYATVAAFFCNWASIQIPQPLLRPLELLGNAAIPIMLILLGMQLSRSAVHSNWGFFSLATFLRLIIGPVIGFTLASLLGLEGLTRKVVILQTSTPSAILPLLYALRFNTRPDLVSGSVFTSTLACSVTLTIVLYLLGG